MAFPQFSDERSQDADGSAPDIACNVIAVVGASSWDESAAIASGHPHVKPKPASELLVAEWKTLAMKHEELLDLRRTWNCEKAIANHDIAELKQVVVRLQQDRETLKETIAALQEDLQHSNDACVSLRHEKSVAELRMRRAASQGSLRKVIRHDGHQPTASHSDSTVVDLQARNKALERRIKDLLHQLEQAHIEADQAKFDERASRRTVTSLQAQVAILADEKSDLQRMHESQLAALETTHRFALRESAHGFHALLDSGANDLSAAKRRINVLQEELAHSQVAEKNLSAQVASLETQINELKIWIDTESVVHGDFRAEHNRVKSEHAECRHKEALMQTKLNESEASKASLQLLCSQLRKKLEQTEELASTSEREARTMAERNSQLSESEQAECAHVAHLIRENGILQRKNAELSRELEDAHKELGNHFSTHSETTLIKEAILDLVGREGEFMDTIWQRQDQYLKGLRRDLPQIEELEQELANARLKSQSAELSLGEVRHELELAQLVIVHSLRESPFPFF
jgi:chromosome segregation ATPase